MDDQKREKLRGQPRSVKKQSPISSFHSRRAVTRAAAAPGDTCFSKRESASLTDLLSPEHRNPWP